MSFHREGQRITLTAEMSPLEYRSLVVALSMVTGQGRKLFRNLPELGWQYVSFVNELLDGDPAFTPYYLPSNRTVPFSLRHVKEPLAVAPALAVDRA